MPLPPQTGENCPGNIGQHVNGISRCVRHKFRTDPFKQRGPENQMQGDFRQRRCMVMLAQAESPMQPENRRERTGDEPEVIEVGMEKPGMDVRLDEPAIDEIGGATHEK